jgi:hypothetical protein
MLGFDDITCLEKKYGITMVEEKGQEKTDMEQ